MVRVMGKVIMGKMRIILWLVRSDDGCSQTQAQPNPALQRTGSLRTQSR